MTGNLFDKLRTWSLKDVEGRMKCPEVVSICTDVVQVFYILYIHTLREKNLVFCISQTDKCHDVNWKHVRAIRGLPGGASLLFESLIW